MRMLSLGIPSAESLRRFLTEQAGLEFSYAAVGATATSPPAGFVVDRTRLQLGSGEAVFRAATAALRRWEQFRLGWVEAWPSQTPIQAGEVVAVMGRALGLWWLNACRIVYVVDDAGPISKFGFAYGTLPGHAESGEERFLLEWDRATDSVWYDILAFSRPNHFLTRLGYPLVRRTQKRFGRDSAAAMFRAVNSAATLPDAVITTDAARRVTFLNPVAQSLTGWTQDEATGVSVEKVFKIVNPETRTRVESPTVRALSEGVNVGLTNRSLLIAKDGRELPIGPIDDSAPPIRDDKGQLAGVVLVFRDSTELCRQERAVQVALAYAESIIATLREPFVVLDKNLRVKTANGKFYKSFHVEKEETEGRFIYDLGNGQWNIPRLRTLLDEVLSDNHPALDFEMEHDFPAIGKKIMLLNARNFKSGDNHPNLILLAIEDITDRRRSEVELKQAEQRQRLVLDSIPQKIATTKPDGDVVYLNPQWMEYTGLSFEQLKDWGGKQFIHPDDVSPAALDRRADVRLAGAWLNGLDDVVQRTRETVVDIVIVWATIIWLAVAICRITVG